jgi:DNA-binding transcriptional regulator YiaG
MANITLVDAEKLKRIRKRLALTQVELAVELGVHPITVAKWETGARGIAEPIAKLVMRIAAERGQRKRKR